MSVWLSSAHVRRVSRPRIHFYSARLIRGTYERAGRWASPPVDDDPDFAVAAAALLGREDGRFAVETAMSADEGLDRLDGGVDGVISDYEMPGRTGVEFADD